MTACVCFVLRLQTSCQRNGKQEVLAVLHLCSGCSFVQLVPQASILSPVHRRGGARLRRCTGWAGLSGLLSQTRGVRPGPDVMACV